MKIICAVDKGWNIGSQGRLLFNLPGDLKRFKSLTENNIVIMGRKTLESLPGGRPLKNRINIVLTRDRNYEKEGVTIVNSKEELKELLQCINMEGDKEEYLIGGGEAIDFLIDQCKEAEITKVLEESLEADTKIPNLDKLEGWSLIDESEEFREEGTPYKYLRYRKK